jgi:NDP-sugar pyrophosphorylase family protein
VDGLYGTCALKPVGSEIRPGVWVGEGARIQPGARVLAPAFIGSYSRVRRTAVVTAFSAVEHHAEIDCGSVVEDSNVLPYTYVGAALDVSHAVVGHHRLVHLKREAEVEIADPKLLGTVSPHAPLRALASAAALAAFLPKQVLRGVMPKQRQCAPSLGAAVTTPSTALKSPAAQHASEKAESEFPSNLVIARRYGNE